MDTIHLVIVTYSHFFKCIKLTPKGVAMCNLFSKRFVQYGWLPERGRYIRKALKVFAARTEDKTEYRFHINTLKSFIDLLNNNGIPNTLYKLEEYSIPEAEDIEFSLKEGIKLRDYQEPIAEYFTQELPRSKFLGLKMGYGKGICTMAGLQELGKRFTVIVKPMYIEKWHDELIEKCNIVSQEILIVKGSGQLMALLELAKHNQITAKAIIISNVTMQNWLKVYEKYGMESIDLGYAFVPEDLHTKLKAGCRIIDEVHQSFWLNAKIDLYTHVRKSISLSATLVNNDPFIEDMYKMVHPLHTRYREVHTEPYIESYAVLYRFNNPDKIRTMEYGAKSFSMNAVERSIMKHIPTLKNYLKLIDYSLEIGFLQHQRKKKKCLIFAYSIEMINLIVSHIKQKFPKYDTRRYVSEDPWEDLMQPDIIVSTLGSAGTAVDIPDLTNVILTNSVSSIQSNLQSFGRLRELKGEHNTVQFHYFVMTDVQKSMDYHAEKKSLFAKEAKSFREFHSGVVV